MKLARLDLSFLADPADCFPDDCLADSVEVEIALTLPPITELVSGLSQVQRLAVLAKTAAQERSMFISMYGDPFGNEQHWDGQESTAPASHLLLAIVN